MSALWTLFSHMCTHYGFMHLWKNYCGNSCASQSKSLTHDHTVISTWSDTQETESACPSRSSSYLDREPYRMYFHYTFHNF